MPTDLAWLADSAPRMEVAHVEQTAPDFIASGTQLGVTYELRYRLEPGALHLELVGERTFDLGLDGADFFDLGWSPLFNSLPVIRDGLLEASPPRDYLMRWVEVPSLVLASTGLFRLPAKSRRSANSGPSEDLGSLVAERPGEYVAIDTTGLDVFAIDPFTFQWVGLDLTAALDVSTRSILAFRLTPFSTQGVDLALVLSDLLSPTPMDARWPANVPYPYCGVPENLPVSDPTRCWHRHQQALCRANLDTADAVSVAGDDQVLGAQRRIDALLDGQLEPTLAGERLAPPVYLRDLLALCNVLDRHARVPEEAQQPAALRGRRLHDHPAELAAVVPRALALADLPDQAALADALRKLADRRYLADGQTLTASRVGPVSATLQGVLRRALTQTTWARATSRMGFDRGAHRRSDDLDDSLQACHVPQLFWAEDYQRELAALFDFDYFTHWLGRRFCSALLLRMLTPHDWHDAARYLDLPEQFVNDRYHRLFTALGANGRLYELARRVKRIANQHAQDGLIDYQQRRALLADWGGIDIETWYLLQPRSRPIFLARRRNMPVRRAHASVWLWCQLTSGHERAAPIELPTENLARHGYFIRDVLPPLRERLVILAELLLATPADARSTLPCRIAAALQRRGHLAENYLLDSIDPLIAARVLAHTSAHTGVDIPSLTTPSSGSDAPPAVTHAQPTLARATVERRRGSNPDFDDRYRQLLDHARELQRQAGYADANLKRGLTRQAGQR